MRSFTLYLFILLLILPSTNTARGEQPYVMIDLANGFEESGLLISEWNVTIKEQMRREDAIHVIEKLTKQFDVIESIDEGSKKYKAIDTHKSTNSDVKYIVILPDNAHFKAELVVTINGHNWDEATKDAYKKHINNLKTTFFTKRSKTFACLTAGFRDTISSVYLINRMKDVYQAKIVSKQADSIEKSMLEEIFYGYTPLWEEKITINGSPINLQFVIKRTSNDGFQITVGTPILINEY